LKFRRISEFFSFVKNLEQREPITEEQLARDIELSERGDYTVMSRVRGKGSTTATVPDISTIPRAQHKSFNDTPTLLAVPFTSSTTYNNDYTIAIAVFHDECRERRF